MEDLQSLDTDVLLSRAREGDLNAQVQLLNSYRDRLRRMISMRFDKRVAARVDASDIVQETLNNALARLPEYFAKPQQSFYMWVRRIATDRLADVYRTHLRAGKRSVLKEQSAAPNEDGEFIDDFSRCLAGSSQNPVRRVMRAEEQDRLKTALAQLKPNDSHILMLRYQEHLSVAEIADALEISQTAVTSRHLRALRRLRRALGYV